MVRGTRLLIGPEADLFFNITTKLRETLRGLGFQEVLLPSLWDQATFTWKAGPEILNQMYTFKDKAERQVCLHP
jgi:histidyl-tRNA synthetase